MIDEPDKFSSYQQVITSKTTTLDTKTLDFLMKYQSSIKRHAATHTCTHTHADRHVHRPPAQTDMQMHCSRACGHILFLRTQATPADNREKINILFTLPNPLVFGN